MTIYIAADHRGFALKEELKRILEKTGYQLEDVGNHTLDPSDDYPDFAAKAAKKVAKNPRSRGIIICGSGVGVNIVANRFKKVRSALVSSVKQAIVSRTDDDSNVLALAADFVNARQARKFVEVWLKTHFAGAPRHKRRIEKMDKIR